MTNISQSQAIALIESTRADGSIFNVTFIKRTNGEVRNMNARLGVKRGQNGVGLAFNAKQKNLIVCYDVQKAQEMKAQGMTDEQASKASYRMINCDSITDLNLKGQRYSVEKL